MKPSVVTTVVLCLALFAGAAMLYRTHQVRSLSDPKPAVQSALSVTTQEDPPPATTVAQPSPATHSSEALKAAAEVATAATPQLPATAAPTADSQNTDLLLSRNVTFREKQALWDKLSQAGALDQTIAELTHRMEDNPKNPACPTMLGEAYIQKIKAIGASGSFNEIGLLALQADQNFDAALKMDPSNWEAHFYKAAALAGWPAEMNRGPEAIQRLANLIDLQDTLPVQPEFAQSYLLLGDQYQKAGQPEYALGTWRLGAQKFPGDTDLQNRLKQRPGH